MERELWIYVQNGRKTFYREHQLTGDFSLVGNGICEAQNEGVLLRLSMKEILEYHSTLEEGTLKIDFVNPRESYDRIVVLDPVGGGRDRGVADSGCEEKNIALEVARQTAQLLEGSMVKIYLTRTEDTEVAQEVRRSFADWWMQICTWRSDCQQMMHRRVPTASGQNTMMSIICRISEMYNGPTA